MKQYRITDFNLDYISYWGGVKRAYPKLYKLYMNDKKDLKEILEKYQIEGVVYAWDQGYSYNLKYEDIPDGKGYLESGLYISQNYEDVNKMLKRVIKTLFGLMYLKKKYNEEKERIGE